MLFFCCHKTYIQGIPQHQSCKPFELPICVETDVARSCPPTMLALRGCSTARSPASKGWPEECVKQQQRGVDKRQNTYRVPIPSQSPRLHCAVLYCCPFFDNLSPHLLKCAQQGWVVIAFQSLFSRIPLYLLLLSLDCLHCCYCARGAVLVGVRCVSGKSPGHGLGSARDASSPAHSPTPPIERINASTFGLSGSVAFFGKKDFEVCIYEVYT